MAKKAAGSGSANVNFDVADLVKLAKDLGVDDRNDLLIVIENGTDQSFSINYQVNHGNYKGSHGSKVLPKIDLTQEAPKATDYEMAFEAAGAGCNVIIDLDGTHKFMVATPVNKSNYIKYKNNDTDWDDIDKHYSDDGFDFYQDGALTFEASITNVNPATCTILIEKT
ncbi:MAG: hypothetical protein AAFP82_05720 [Bacteroidota bacterium]